MHWAAAWIGRRYPDNGCWQFVADVHQQVFDVPIDDFADYRDPPLKRFRKIQREIQVGPWELLQEPIDGCAVAMTQSNVITHVGIYADADGGLILHTLKGQVIGSTETWLNRYLWKVRYYQCLLK